MVFKLHAYLVKNLFMYVVSSDAEHFPQQTFWFCPCARKDLFGIKSSPLNSQRLRSSANNVLMKQKHFCKCHCLTGIPRVFCNIIGEERTGQ